MRSAVRTLTMTDAETRRSLDITVGLIVTATLPRLERIRSKDGAEIRDGEVDAYEGNGEW